MYCVKCGVRLQEGVASCFRLSHFRVAGEIVEFCDLIPFEETGHRSGRTAFNVGFVAMDQENPARRQVGEYLGQSFQGLVSDEVVLFSHFMMFQLLFGSSESISLTDMQ